MISLDWEQRRGSVSSPRTRDPRLEEDRDLARVIHSGSFRRLQSKTQVLGLGESDFYRTRLTHSVEVAQIATGIRRFLENEKSCGELASLLPGIPTITAIALAHDIGHPPFGHGGEVALNYMMRGNGGFEGNAQSLRILCRLEKKTKDFGLNLTRRTLLGILKYPVTYSEVVNEYQKSEKVVKEVRPNRVVDATCWKPPKCFLDEDMELVEWILDPLSASDRRKFRAHSEAGAKKHGVSKHKSFDASLMDKSDDISYAVHDLEDAIHLGFIRECNEDREKLNGIFSSLDKHWLAEWELSDVVDKLFGEKWDRKEAISRLVNCLICSCRIDRVEGFESPLLSYNVMLSDNASFLIKELQKIVESEVIFQSSVQTLEYSGQQLIMELYEAMAASPKRLLPEDTQRILGESARDKERVVCDHISGMTDDYAARIHGRLFSPNTGSIFEKM